MGAPKPPAWLPRVAAAEWRRVVKAAAVYPTWLQELDRAGLTAYCMAWAAFEEAARDVGSRGVLVGARSSADKARGASVKNPALQIMREAGESMRRWARELGFTPDARGRVDLGVMAADEWAERLLTPVRPSAWRSSSGGSRPARSDLPALDVGAHA